MGLRPNICYRSIERSNTRHGPKVQAKDFLGGVPGVRTRQFVMGDQRTNYEWVLDLKATSPVQVRDNALEALRQKITRELGLKVGKDNWLVRIRQYPYHVLRENKAATGAGADRVSKGMKHAFGRNIGRAVQVRKNDILLSVLVDTPYIEIAKRILERSKYKIFMDYEIVLSKHTNMQLSGRKKWVREVKVAEVEAPKEEKATTPAVGKDGKPDPKAAAPAKGAAPKADDKAKTADKGKKK